MKLKAIFTSGKMNKDADERLLEKGEYRDALNVKVANSEGSDVGAIENSLSNQIKSSGLDLGTNAECIGSVSSDKLKTVFWFVVSDSGSHIVEYNEGTDTASFVLSDSTGLLNFSSSYRINNSDIVIDDDNDKVFIYWTDNLNNPRRIEVSEAKTWTTFSESDISVIRSTPSVEPTIVGYDSLSITDNLIEDKMFSFAYRYQYTHGEWSALSTFSTLGFQAGVVDTDLTDVVNQGMQNTWNELQVSYWTGGPDVKKVEVYAVENGKSNAYRVHLLEKTSPLSDNVLGSFYFRNDKSYPVLSSSDFNKVYDNVPIKAATQTIVANRLVYGAYEENYDVNINLNYSLTHISSPIVGGQAQRTLKAGQTYEVGLVYYDQYGRKSTVLAMDSSEIKIIFDGNDFANKIRVGVTHNAPSWATKYKFAVKSNVGNYDTIRTDGPAYKKDGFLYIKMHQEDYNKLNTERWLVVKNNGQGPRSTKYKFDFVEISTVDADFLFAGSLAGAYAKFEASYDFNTVFSWNPGALANPAQVIIASGEYLVFESEEKTAPESAYYEVPGFYDIVDGYHSGNVQDQTPSVSTAIVDLEAYNAWCFGDGAESSKVEDSQVNLQVYLGVRVNEEIDNYKKTVRSASMTYSDVYEQSTGYNGLSSFNLSQANYKDLDDKYGSITKIVSKDTDLIAFQEDKIHRILVNKNVLYTASGAGSVTQTLSVLGQEVSYLGEYGVNSSPESIQFWKNDLYFVDNRRGAACILTLNGIFEISQYGMKRWFNDNVSLESGNVAISGYDPYNDHYVSSIGGQYTLTYSNDYKGWTSFYSYIPESMISVGNNFYTFKDGHVYRHNVKVGDRNKFYGATTPANTEVELVFNDSPSEVKIFKTIQVEGNTGVWNVDINTNLDDGHIISNSFVKKEGMFDAYIRRNASDELNAELLSINGIGTLVSYLGNVFSFSNLPSGTRVGDNLYFSDGSNNLLVGNIIDVVSNGGLKDVTVGAVANVPVGTTEFFFSAKNPVVESNGIKGYYASVRLSNNESKAIELFAVNSEIVKSFI